MVPASEERVPAKPASPAKRYKKGAILAPYTIDLTPVWKRTLLTHNPFNDVMHYRVE